MGDVLKPFVPLFYKELLIPEEPGAPPEPYLEIQDLLGNFQNPSVMDVKMVRLIRARTMLPPQHYLFLLSAPLILPPLVLVPSLLISPYCTTSSIIHFVCLLSFSLTHRGCARSWRAR